MRITSSSTQILRSRIARVLALSAMVVLAGCEDVTAPQEEVTAAPELKLSQGVVNELGTLSTSLDDMTGWSLAALPNAQGKANIVGILNGLRGHLASGKIAACQPDEAEARAVLGAL